MPRRVAQLAAPIAVAVGIAVALVTASVTEAANREVTLRLPAASLRAGQQVDATVVNDADASLELAECSTLARFTGGRWVTITRTHGVDVACPARNPVTASVKAHSHASINVDLYDDLAPGTYRVTLPYRTLSRSTTEPPFRADSTPVAAVEFRVLAFDPGPAPHLSESRIRAIALKHARAQGDARPTLIQDAEGSRFMANLVGSGGDEVFAWNWSYLIAIRGSFESPPIPTPVGIPTGPGPVRIRYSVLTLVVDAQTGEVTDSDFSRVYPRLSRLGLVSTDRN
jgi:hypothetical protein